MANSVIYFLLLSTYIFLVSSDILGPPQDPTLKMKTPQWRKRPPRENEPEKAQRKRMRMKSIPRKKRRKKRLVVLSGMSTT